MCCSWTMQLNTIGHGSLGMRPHVVTAVVSCSDSSVLSWHLESGLAPFCPSKLNKPQQFLDNLGRVEESSKPQNHVMYSTYWRVLWNSLIFIPNPSQGSQEVLLALRISRPCAFSLLRHTEPKQVMRTVDRLSVGVTPSSGNQRPA